MRVVGSLRVLIGVGVVLACAGCDVTRQAPGVEAAVAVPPELRDQALVFDEETSFGKSPAESESALWLPTSVVAIQDHRVFIADSRGGRVQVYGWNGEFLHTLSRHGQGPGEFQDPFALAILGDRLLVADRGNLRHSFWTLDGAHDRDVRLDPGTWPLSQLGGLSDGTVVGIARSAPVDLRSAPSSGRTLFRRDPATHENIGALYEFDPKPALRLPGSRKRLYLPRTTERVRVGLDDTIYFTHSGDYEILVFDKDGTRRQSITVPWTRFPITDDEIDRAFAAAGSSRAAWGDEVEVPSVRPSLSHIAVDGAGNLYVFLFPAEARAARVMVDVYAPDGRRIFAGWSEPIYWTFAVGSHVFTITADESGELFVTRHRLELPEAGGEVHD